MKIFLLAVSGASGTLTRFFVSSFAQKMCGGYSCGTLTVNLAGCLLAGAFSGLFEMYPAVAEHRFLIMTGFMGAFTTFSAYMVDFDLLLKNSGYTAAFTYFLASNLAGFAFFIAGNMAVRSTCAAS